MRRSPAVLVVFGALLALAGCGGGGGGGASKSEERITDGNAQNVCYWGANVSDDAAKLVYERDLNTGGSIWTETLDANGVATGERQAVDAKGEGTRPVFVEGGRVAYLDVSELTSGGGNSIVVLGEDGSGKSRLPVDGRVFDLSVSPDRSWLYFTLLEGEGAELHRIRPDGSGNEALFSDPLGIDSPAVAPDGKTVAYARYRKNDMGELVPELVTSGLDGSGRKVVAAGGPPAWSPDGTRLAYIGPAGKADDGLPLEQIYVMPAGGGEPQAVTGSDSAKTGAPVWFGDGRVAYLYESTTEDFCQLFAVDAPASS